MSACFEASDLSGGGKIFRELEPPAILGVFGDPVAHSLSPAFQTAGLMAAGIKGSYVGIRARAEEFPAALHAIRHAGLVGANVTIPHKAAALAAVDEADEAAQRAGGVNTVVVDGGRLLGFSTDGPGLVRAIREEFMVDLRDLRVLVLGAAGGAGRAAAVQCAIEGCERLVLANRTFPKAAALAAELAPMLRSDRLEGPTDRVMAIPMDEAPLREEISRIDLVINATPLGMKRTDPSPLPAELIGPALLVYDMVYSSGSSRLVLEALSAGARAVNGLSMLLHQGALSFELWFNKPAPLAAMRAALKKAAASPGQ
jgi:shikimate dehydrogenase